MENQYFDNFTIKSEYPTYFQSGENGSFSSKDLMSLGELIARTDRENVKACLVEASKNKLHLYLASFTKETLAETITYLYFHLCGTFGDGELEAEIDDDDRLEDDHLDDQDVETDINDILSVQLKEEGENSQKQHSPLPCEPKTEDHSQRKSIKHEPRPSNTELKSVKKTKKKEKEEEPVEYEEIKEVEPTEQEILENPHRHCALCNKMFSTKANYKIHFNTVHLKAKKHCNICNKEYAHLHQHMRKRHNGAPNIKPPSPTPFEKEVMRVNDDQVKMEPVEEPLSEELLEILEKAVRDDGKCDCPECGKVVVKGHFLLHYRSAHQVTENPCDQCDKTFGTPAMLKRHKAVVHSTERHPCSECGKVFKWKGMLDRHLLTVHDIKVEESTKNQKQMCHLCGKYFVNKGCLVGHMNNVHLNIKRFSCDNCDAKFYTKTSLKKHHNREHLGLTHVCEICGKAFRDKDSIPRHLREIHNRQIMGRCPICNKGFRSKYNMKAHVKEVHKDMRDIEVIKKVVEEEKKMMELMTQKVQEQQQARRSSSESSLNHRPSGSQLSRSSTPPSDMSPESDRYYAPNMDMDE